MIRPSRGTRFGLLALLLWVAAGCATYSETLQGARLAADAGDYESATEQVDRQVGAASDKQIPSKLKGDQVLALLERGTLLQAESRFPDSARDFSAGDEGLEWLDLSPDALGTIGEYVYSDSAGVYRSPPSERLALSGFNALNYLARGDLSGAAVEARRYTVMREYLDSREVKYGGALGAYLAGFTFERRGEGDRALRYYNEALVAGASAEALTEPVVRLAAIFPYRTPLIRSMLARGGGGKQVAQAPSEILFVIATGRVPYKVPERIPVGVAIGIAGTFITGDAKALSRGVAKVVVYPELVAGPTGNTIRGVSVDGRSVSTHLIDDLAFEVRREYEEIKPRIIAAALSRLIVRAAVAEGVRAASSGQSSAVSSLLAVFVEGALVALDKPDTRSWTMLPASVAAARVPVEPGKHSVVVELAGERRTFSVVVPPSGFATIVVTAPR